jgi:hypothetical protein
MTEKDRATHTDGERGERGGERERKRKREEERKRKKR